MRVLAVNAGSSTLKLRLVTSDDEIEATFDLDPWDGSTETNGVSDWLRNITDVDAIGHRVVHGGDRFTSAVRIDDEVLRGIGELTSLAPLHQPRALSAIEVARGAMPGVTAVACFDTAFHASMPAPARTYALPMAWRNRWPLYRYGFHGLSHAWVTRRAAELVGQPIKDLRIVSCHLGAGASLCAVLGGRSVETTMGFTPLEGLVMATRAGSVDPGLVLWLLQQDHLSLSEVAYGLEHDAGLAGLAGGSGDMREVVAGIARGDANSCLAFAVHAHRLRREIAAMAAALGGLDIVLFTGGIGEHQPTVRSAAADGLEFLGIGIDPVRNLTLSGDFDISAHDSSVRTLVVSAREDLEIARQVRDTLQ